MRLSLLLGLLGGLGCAPGGADLSLENQACDALRVGPVENVTAAISTGAGPKVRPSPKRYDLQLVDDVSAKARAGSVTLEQTQDKELLLFVDSDVPLTLVNAFQEPRPLVASPRVAACAKMQQKLSVDLQRGSYFLKFGPTDKLHVGLVLLHRE